MVTLRITLVALGMVVSFCRFASAQSQTTSEHAPSAVDVEPTDERDACRRARLYVTPSLFTMSGSTWTTTGGGTMMTSGENTFHRVAAGGLLRSCEQFPNLAARVGVTAALHSNVSGFGLEAEIDYGAGSPLQGGLRIGVELGTHQHIISAGPRIHFFETAFLGIDAYTARDAAYTSRGVMVGFGLEGRAGRWAVVGEAVLATIFFGAYLAGGGPD